MGGSPEWGGWERNYKSKVFLWSTKTFHHMQPLGNMYNSRELAGGKGRVTAEKKQGQKSTCKDFRYQGGKKKKKVCGRLKMLLFLKGNSIQCPAGEQQTDPKTANLYQNQTNHPWDCTKKLCSCLWQNCRRQVGRAHILSRQELQGVASHRPREKNLCCRHES